MNRSELEELHYLTPISNLGSILANGILSNVRVRSLAHESIADPVIQDRRSKVQVPGGRPLHQYVNLYFTARNPMMYKRRELHAMTCILRVAPSVIELPGVVISSGNSSAEALYVRFAAASLGLAIIDKDATYARYWTDPDPIQYWRKKSAKCAEVLVPDIVPVELITGIYVSCQAAKALVEVETDLPVLINPDLFFQ